MKRENVPVIIPELGDKCHLWSTGPKVNKQTLCHKSNIIIVSRISKASIMAIRKSRMIIPFTWVTLVALLNIYLWGNTLTIKN